MKPFSRIEGICIHHSATPDGTKARDTDGIRHFHTHPALNGETITEAQFYKLRGQGVSGLRQAWEEIGYHFLVERVDGLPQVVEGRDIRYQGAHCPPLNADHLGVCLVGNYDLAAPDNDMLDCLAALVGQLMDEYKIPLNGIKYHCDYSEKTCPGRQFPKGGFLLQLAGEERPCGQH